MQTTPRASARKERKVSIVLRRSEELKHCAGVECVLAPPDSGLLFTASRDSTVKRWNINPGVKPTCDATFEGHADWVNSLALVNNLLFSCSNDTTVRVWDSNTGYHHAALTYHSDYVTCLAAAPERNSIVSAGLRGEIFLIDIATATTHKLRPNCKPPPSPQHPAPAPHTLPAYGTAAYSALSPDDPHSNGHQSHSPGLAAPASSHKAGVYSLAVSSSGTVVAAGSSESIIRLWDTRSHEKVGKLRGHTENVRCLLLNPTCTAMLSGSADGTIKLWDLGMQRCIQTFAVHTDSVWSMQISPDWSSVLSGGRDKAVFRTHLASRTAELLLREQHPINCIAYDAKDACLWVSTPSSTVHQWQLPKQALGGGRPSGEGALFSAAPHIRVPSTSHHGRAHTDGRGQQAGRQPLISGPSAVLQGMPPIVAHKVLSDRRHILTKDADGNVSRWDVLAGAETGRYGKVSMDDMERKLFEARHCPSWFVADNRLGQLSISLEPPHCFNAEEYAQALGYPEATEDAKVNLGKLVLEGAFALWRQQQLRGPTMEGLGPGSATSQDPTSPVTAVVAGQQGGAASQNQPPFTGLWPKYWQVVKPAVVCQTAGGVVWRKLITQFTPDDREPDVIPAWVADVVLRQAVITPKEAMTAFSLLPLEGSGLPSLLQSGLNAPRILQVHKVALYCHNTLQEQNITLWPRPVYWKQPVNPPILPTEAQPGQPYYELELTCNGMLVPYDLSLSSVKKFIWRRSDDVVLHYSVRNPSRPAPMPDIQPPEPS
ncbi:WD40-repeat-containing domain protein [Haematococcus lacustris]